MNLNKIALVTGLIVSGISFSSGLTSAYAASYGAGADSYSAATTFQSYNNLCDTNHGQSISFGPDPTLSTQIKPLHILSSVPTCHSPYPGGGTSDASAEAKLYGTAKEGDITVYASASTTTVDTGQSPIGVNPHSGGGGRQQWYDTLTFTSNTLPNGTPVDINLSYSLNSLVGGNGQASVSSYYTANGSILADFIHCNFSCGASGSPYQTGSTLTSALVGYPFTIGGLLDYSVYAGGGNSTATLDVSHTALFGIDVLTPGASYSAASGTVYLKNADVGASVPEPLNILGASAGLALFGTVSTALKKRKLSK